MTDGLAINVDKNCFNVVDRRIDMLMHGKLSAEHFAMLLTPDDPFVLIDKTIYVMTPIEYYSTLHVHSMTDFVTRSAETIMQQRVIDTLPDDAKQRINEIKASMNGCTTCQLKRYKQELYRLAKKYAITPADIPAQPQIAEYPKLVAPVEPLVSLLIADLYKVPALERAACVECCEKHLAQAYILANESIMGYPEHLQQACAHLSECLAEAPTSAHVLTTAVQFCQAKSVKDNKAFVPLFALLPALLLIKADFNAAPDMNNSRTEAPISTDIDFTDAMKAELEPISASQRCRLLTAMKTVRNSILEYKKDHAYQHRIAYEGALACAADFIAQSAPIFANMLRNRRLLFNADIALAADAGYDSTDLIAFLEDQEKVSVTETD